MKTRFSLIYLAIVSLLGISLCISCDKKDETKGVVTYKGIVVYDKTTTPFPDLEVKLTDGNNVSATTKTNAEGAFSFKVDLSTINGDYYFLVGDATCIQKKVNIPGWGQAEIDLGTIGIEGPTLPEVKTIAVTNITADAANAGGEVLSDGRLEVTARGVCYSTKEYPTIDDLHTSDGTGIGEFTSSLKNLEFKTIYYVRAYATNKKGTAYGEQVMFTTEAGVAIVTTDTIINITAHTAKCKATVVSDGGFAVVKRGICWSKRPDPTVDDEITDDGSGLGEFTATLKDLLENTTYYVRAYATNSTATVYGRQIIINTLDGLPVVTTNKTDNITATGFVCFGTVVSDCDIPVTARGFCYSKNQYPTLDDEHTTSGKGLGEFQSTISKLEYGTTYYVRAYATNETATTYGEQLSITTLSGLATVTTKNVTNIGSVKATCGGNVTNDGTLTVTARGVCYGTEQQPTIDGDHTTDGKGKGEFTSSLKDLKDKTTYYVRAYATTDAGTTYGEQKSFKTEDGTPVVELKTVSNITATGALCKGNVTGDGGLDVTERGFCYSTSQYPQISDKHLAVGSGMGEYSASLTELEVGTTYYVRAYATNGVGTGYSEQQTFLTTSGLATLTTTNATSTAFTITAGGNITENGGFAVNERGLCYSSTNSEPSITDGKLSGGSGNGTFTVTIPELTPNTLYYIRAYATNSIGTTYGNVVSVTTKDGVANVSTGDIVNITALTATGGVSVTDAGGATLKSCGICWSTTQNPTISDSHIQGGTQLGTYSCNMTELTPNTTYYVRAYATTDVKTTYGNQVLFKTKDGQATLTTAAITNIMALTATSGVSVTDAGGATLKSCGICWSTTQNPTISDSHIQGGTQLGTYSCNMTELTPNTTYYVRAYATTDVTVSYGEQKSFTTTSGLPIVLTQSTSTKATSISIIGDVTDNGGYNVKERGFCYSKTNSEPTLTDIKVECGSGNGSFNTTISNLSTSTTYYIRAYATNEIGTSYGKTLSATTQSGAAIVSLGTITNNTITSVTGSVKVTDAGGATLNSCGICWSTSTNPTIKDNKVEASGKQLNQTYSCTLTGLTSGTTYYARAYATTDITTTYSSATMFTTMVNVTGVVKDESTGKVIPYASVVFKLGNSTMRSTTTNTAGQFEVQLISNSYTVIATATGYCDFSNTIQVGSDPITILMRPLGILSGKVYDDDNMPLANATVSLRSSSGTNFSAVTNSDGLYKIENIPLGQTTRITCTLQKYTLSADIPSLNINSGTNNLDISMKLLYPLECNVSALVFECMNDAQCGTKVTNTFKITNNRQKTVSWSLTGIPTKGITFSPSSGSIPAKSSVTVTATFTYPGPSVSGSVKTTLYNCVFENQKWTHTYLWNWTVSGNIWDNCTTHCYQEVTVLGGNNSIIIPIELFQYVVWN